MSGDGAQPVLTLISSPRDCRLQYKKKSRDIKTCWQRWRWKTGSSWLNQPPCEARQAWRRISAACQSEEWVWHSGPDCPSLFLLPLFVVWGRGGEIHWQRHQALRSGDRLSINSSTLTETLGVLQLNHAGFMHHAYQTPANQIGERSRGRERMTQLGFLQAPHLKLWNNNPGIIRAPLGLRVGPVFNVASDHRCAQTEPQCPSPGVQLISVC